MWSYYGAKTNVVDFYPGPKEHKVIEPFAGSARYSLKYFEKDVLLVDKYEVVIKIWKWLQLCSEKDILSLPRRMKAGESLNDFKFDCEEAKLLMGFLVGYGLERPRVKATTRLTHRPNFINFSLIRIAKQLFKIRHWVIQHGSYENIKNQKATWFIDPPYKKGGECYPESSNNINFNKLANWSMERDGQVIICENINADWLIFNPLMRHKTRCGVQKEGIWTNEPTGFDNLQIQLF